jgi:hypothetical protein
VRLVNTAIVVTAALALGACSSLSKGIDTVRDLSEHEPEQVDYPSLADIPEKPQRPGTPAEHNAAVQSLQADRAAVDADAQKLREDAASMPTLTPPKGRPR